MAERKRQLFLDCDGVLADFDKRFEEIFGISPWTFQDQNGDARFWADLRDHPEFYRNLPLIPDAKALYQAVKHLNPIILTGLPRSGSWAEAQKQAWAKEHFPGVPVICCLSINKRDHMQPGDVLVDDRTKYRHLWEQAGGIFIHHESAEQSVPQILKIFAGEGPNGNQN